MVRRPAWTLAAWTARSSSVPAGDLLVESSLPLACACLLQLSPPANSSWTPLLPATGREELASDPNVHASSEANVSVRVVVGWVEVAHVLDQEESWPMEAVGLYVV